MNRWFQNVCQKYAERVLIRPSFKYKDLIPLARKQTNEYADRGVKKGDRIILSQYNSVDFLVRLQAIWELGATPCLVSPKLALDKKHSCEQLLISSTVPPIPEALLMLTSGTSSKIPKGVRLSHGNILTHIDMLREHIPTNMFHQDDRTLSFLPWTHCYGLMGECFSVMDRGASMSILSLSAQEQFRFPIFFKDLQFCQPTILFVVPYLLEVILRRDIQIRKLLTNRSMRKAFWFGSNIRYIVSGGAFLKPDIRKAFWDEFDIEIIQGYGCSEMSPMVSLQTKFDPSDLSVGELLPNVQVEIKDDEVWVNGPNRFIGYVGEGEIPIALSYNTRDRGYVKDNKLYLTGRSSNMLKLSNGKFMDVHQIEKMIRDHISHCREVCVWQGDDRRLYGIAHITHVPSNEQDVKPVQTFPCFEENVTVMVQKTSFLSPIDGSMTSKGEMCRPIIQSMHERRIKKFILKSSE